MVPELARMAVIIKSAHETSVMTGNYELGYACGLLCRLAGVPVPKWETPGQLQEKVLASLEGYQPKDEKEKTVLHMLQYYHPDDTNDEQVGQMLQWGFTEEHIWQTIVH